MRSCIYRGRTHKRVEKNPFVEDLDVMYVMELDRFLPRKEILIDDAGWGDLILGVVIGALKLPDCKYLERRIQVSSFQSPNFGNKKYLDDAVKIAKEIVEVMQPDRETRFKVCSGYVLSSIRGYLRD